MPRRPSPTIHPWEGTAYRATTYDVPLWVRPNRRDGRLNVAGGIPTQYLCLEADPPYAEMLRHEQLHTEADAAMLRVNLFEVNLHEAAIVDFSTFELAEAAGFPPEALVDDDYEQCQREAEWLVANGARGVLTPSAALPGGTNLTLFGPGVEVPWGTTPKLAAEVPVRRLGGKGPPPVGLVANVRHFGQPHAAYKAFKAAKTRVPRTRQKRKET